MKKSFFILTILCFCSISLIHAQHKVALHSNATTTIFGGANSFIDAYNASITGDTIYLPGGSFTVPASFKKGVAIIGAGFHPDSTLATLPTVLNGDINIDTGADGISFEGLLINNSVHKNFSIIVNNITITRCRVNGLFDLGRNGIPSVNSSQLVIIQSVLIGNVDLEGMQNVLISNSIIQNQILNSLSNTFKNNSYLKLTTSANIFISCINNVISNSVFNTASIGITVGTGNIFQNNIFASATPSLGAGAVDLNNYKGIVISTVYTNQTGHVFDYAHNYHLLTAASTLYSGDDSAEVGIYGGMFPLKEGFVPQNPHISSKIIAPATDVNGVLNIQIQVEAQN